MQKEDVKQWIVNGPSPRIINIVKQFGEKIKQQGLTTSQIRQVFSKLKSIEAKGFDKTGQRMEFIMLKPLIAYASGRHKKRGLEWLKERIDWGIDAVLEGPEAEEQQRFKNFCKMFEAILAYHKAHGGS